VKYAAIGVNRWEADRYWRLGVVRFVVNDLCYGCSEDKVVFFVEGLRCWSLLVEVDAGRGKGLADDLCRSAALLFSLGRSLKSDHGRGARWRCTSEDVATGKACRPRVLQVSAAGCPSTSKFLEWGSLWCKFTESTTLTR